ncbi:hypothetical protein RJZ56_000662 [Blastomyces dermatitidis]
MTYDIRETRNQVSVAMATRRYLEHIINLKSLESPFLSVYSLKTLIIVHLQPVRDVITPGSLILFHANIAQPPIFQTKGRRRLMTSQSAPSDYHRTDVRRDAPIQAKPEAEQVNNANAVHLS